jgi:hypothetical protein
VLNQSRFKISAIVVAALLALGISTLGYASGETDTVKRSNWVPNVGERDFRADEQPLGDMWTFVCPAGGAFKLSIDTKDDTDVGRADIDPLVVVLDGHGNVVGFGDDEFDCKYRPVCGYSCPAVETKCGNGAMHSIVVRDFGTANQEDTLCQEGGGYELDLRVDDALGQRVREVDIKLGGGALRTIPMWALKEGKAPVGPALDDENVPNPSEGSASEGSRRMNGEK